MPRRSKQEKLSLQQDDVQALELFEDAQRQFQRYQELHDIIQVLPQQEAPEPPAPTWASPLTLVLRH
jgi:hypothetical protein